MQTWISANTALWFVDKSSSEIEDGQRDDLGEKHKWRYKQPCFVSDGIFCTDSVVFIISSVVTLVELQ